MANTDKNEQDNADYNRAYEDARSGPNLNPVDFIERSLFGEKPAEQAGREDGTADRHQYGSR